MSLVTASSKKERMQSPTVHIGTASPTSTGLPIPALFIALVRSTSGLSQTKIAAIMGVKVGKLTKWERGEEKVPEKAWAKILYTLLNGLEVSSTLVAYELGLLIHDLQNKNKIIDQKLNEIDEELIGKFRDIDLNSIISIDDMQSSEEILSIYKTETDHSNKRIFRILKSASLKKEMIKEKFKVDLNRSKIDNVLVILPPNSSHGAPRIVPITMAASPLKERNPVSPPTDEPSLPEQQSPTERSPEPPPPEGPLNTASSVRSRRMVVSSESKTK